MAKSITVFVAKDFTHSGRPVKVGDRLTVSPIEAASLNYRKLATLTERSMAKAPLTSQMKAEPAPQPEPEKPKRRRTYKRRDLRAEESE